MCFELEEDLRGSREVSEKELGVGLSTRSRRTSKDIEGWGGGHKERLVQDE